VNIGTGAGVGVAFFSSFFASGFVGATAAVLWTGV